jgi:hypothetical protein
MAQVPGSLPTKKSTTTASGYSCRARIKDVDYYLDALTGITDGLEFDTVIGLSDALVDEMEQYGLNEQHDEKSFLKAVKTYMLSRR